MIPVRMELYFDGSTLQETEAGTHRDSDPGGRRCLLPPQQLPPPVSSPPPAPAKQVFVEAPLEGPAFLGIVSAISQSSTGTINVLLIFAQFANERHLGEGIPAYADQLFDPGLPGSFAHFFDVMSFGQLKVEGTVLPKRYTSSDPSSKYLANTPAQQGKFSTFTRDILKQVDVDVDLTKFDNNGVDGIPNSGDDDGNVDYIFVLMRSVPEGFIQGKANGHAGLGRDFRSKDPGINGRNIGLMGKHWKGSLLEEGRGEGGFVWTTGIMAHEFGHALSLPDLYDISFLKAPGQDPSEDGAGIGKWGLMGRGWAGTGVPTMCAWSREKLGWLGRDNEHLVVLEQPVTELRLRDVHNGGAVYKVFVEEESQEVEAQEREYLLFEHRVRTAHYYNRLLTIDGALVWHVRPPALTNQP